MQPLCPYRTEVTILSTNQRTECVARTCQHPFKSLSASTEEYWETSTAQYDSVRITPTFGGGNANHVAPLHTELTCTLRWKCGISSRLKEYMELGLIMKEAETNTSQEIIYERKCGLICTKAEVLEIVSLRLYAVLWPIAGNLEDKKQDKPISGNKPLET